MQRKLREIARGEKANGRRTRVRYRRIEMKARCTYGTKKRIEL